MVYLNDLICGTHKLTPAEGELGERALLECLLFLFVHIAPRLLLLSFALGDAMRAFGLRVSYVCLCVLYDLRPRHMSFVDSVPNHVHAVTVDVEERSHVLFLVDLRDR